MQIKNPCVSATLMIQLGFRATIKSATQIKPYKNLLFKFPSPSTADKNRNLITQFKEVFVI